MPNIMTQISATGPLYAFANRYIHSCANKVFTANLTWQNEWGANAFLKTSGIGICAYYPANDNATPAFNGPNQYWGAWTTGFYPYSRGWIGYDSYSPADFTPEDFPSTSPGASTAIVSIGPHLGGDLFDVTMRWIGGAYDIQFTETVYLPGGHCIFSISGNLYLGSQNPFPLDNNFAVTAVSVT